MPEDLDGRSLAPLLAGEPLPPRRYFAETRRAGDLLAKKRMNHPDPRRRAQALAAAREKDPGSVAVFEGRVKAVWSQDELRVYDLARDPRELQPSVADGGDEHLAVLRDLASSYHRGTEVERELHELSETLRKELEALGYLQ